MAEILISSTFARQFKGHTKSVQKRIRKGLEQLEQDPVAPRPGADIKPLKGTKPPKHRLRIGTYRIVYRVEKKRVFVLDLFQRGREYRE